MSVLAFDIGGTKTLAALVVGGNVVESLRFPTVRNASPDSWLESLDQSTSEWSGRYRDIGFAVSGQVCDGVWSTLNPTTLSIPRNFPLAARAKTTFGLEPILINDAQAAAFGEFTHGAGRGDHMVFLTISSGVGGGIVANGEIVLGKTGLAGHFGQTRDDTGERLEDRVSGLWMAAQALASGHDVTAKEVFEAADAGERWAEAIIEQSARRVARLCADIAWTLDPARIVIGGGVGMAPGYLERISMHLNDIPSAGRPPLVRAELGAFAGILGVAALIERRTSTRSR